MWSKPFLPLCWISIQIDFTYLVATAPARSKRSDSDKHYFLVIFTDFTIFLWIPFRILPFFLFGFMIEPSLWELICYYGLSSWIDFGWCARTWDYGPSLRRQQGSSMEPTPPVLALFRLVSRRLSAGDHIRLLNATTRHALARHGNFEFNLGNHNFPSRFQ